MSDKSIASIANISEQDLLSFTPAMRQFIQIKRDNPTLLIMYRMGDFYETFFEDAELVHRVLGLTLTSRSSTNSGARIPMAGIPYMTLDQYLVRLVNQGFSVGICEQLGTPGKGLMERKLVRTITPGTLTDESLLNDRSESTLLAVYIQGKGSAVGLAWMTISSGVFKAMETTEAGLLNEIERINPSEILIADHDRELAEERFPDRSVSALPDWHFDRIRAEKTLLKQFGTSTLEPFGIADSDLLITAAGVVAEYARSTQGTDLTHITAITRETDNDHLGLDAASRRNLEIVRTLRGEQTNTLFSTLDHCRTAMGSRRLASWLTSPCRDQSEATKRSDAVEILLGSMEKLENINEFLKSIPDFERTATRIALGSVKPRELAALRDALPSLNVIAENLSDLDSELLKETAEELPLPEELYQLLCASLKKEPSTFIRDGNVIAEGFNAELDELRALKNHGGQFLVDYEAREKERTGIPNLRVEFNSVQGYFIEVPKGQIDKVPADYRRRQTLKNVERYITPELKAFEDKAVSAEERSKALEKQLYEELILKCKPFCQDLLNSAHGVSALDALSSFAQHADTYRWIKPNFVPVTSVEIKSARHPVVEETIENYVPNDCDLDAQHRLHIITGPNMGGKSTYMRSIALIVLLAYSGSFVPAESADIGVIDKILTRIGAADDLARGLSTFMVEMTETASILRQATDKSLVLMDEVGRGTSTFDGLSLAAAIAEDLVVNCRSLTLFATHYFELTQLEKTLPDVVNVHVAAAESSKNIVFLHEIRPGAANQSYGIAVAKLAGIPRSVIRGAQKVLLKLEERAAQTDDKQLDLFVASEASSTVFPEEELPEEDPTLLELRDQLSDVSMDDLSPRQAWELLADLQKKAKETK